MSPVRTSVVAVELKVWLTVVPLGVGTAVTLYPVIEAVPESAGAVHVQETWAFPPVPVTPVGAPGSAVQVRVVLPGQPA